MFSCVLLGRFFLVFCGSLICLICRWKVWCWCVCCGVFWIICWGLLVLMWFVFGLVFVLLFWMVCCCLVSIWCSWVCGWWLVMRVWVWLLCWVVCVCLLFSCLVKCCCWMLCFICCNVFFLVLGVFGYDWIVYWLVFVVGCCWY